MLLFKGIQKDDKLTLSPKTIMRNKGIQDYTLPLPECCCQHIY